MQKRGEGDRRTLVTALRVLEDCRLLVKEPDLFRSGRARYRIAEPLITFYQAIMSREWARLELGDGPAVWPGARARFLSQVAGPHFEAICRAYATTAAGPQVGFRALYVKDKNVGYYEGEDGKEIGRVKRAGAKL